MSWSYEHKAWKPFLRFWERREVDRLWRGVYWDTQSEYRLREKQQ